jgi:outer membrane receptor for ferrienterochelin and colicins
MLKKFAKNSIKLTLALTTFAAGTQVSAQSVNYLQLEELFNEAVTISATGKPLKASQAPVPMIIIGRDDIRRSGASNLGALLQNYAGIDVNRFGATQYEVAVRGGTEAGNPRLLVLVNGRQVYLDHYGLTNWEGIGVTPEEIRQIEVIKGPNSALYGFNASQGVINIITVNPLHETARAVTVTGGNGGAREVRGVATLKLNERVGFKLSASYAELDALKRSSKLPVLPGFPAASDSKRRGATIENTTKLSDSTEVFASYSYNMNSGRYVSPSYNEANENFVTHGAQARVSSDTRLGLISGSIFYNALNNSFSGIAPGVPSIAFKNQAYGAQLSNLFKLSASDTLRLAVEYRKNALHYEPDTSGETKTNLYAVSGMWNRQFTDKVALTLAGRWDHLSLGHGPIPAVVVDPRLPAIPITPFVQADFNRSINVWSANGGLVFNATDNDTFRLSAARGSQAPSLVSLGLTLPFGATPNGIGVLSGRPSINPSISYTVDAGYDRTIAAIGGKLRLGAFYNWVNDVIQFPSFSDPAFIRPPFSYSAIKNGGNYTSGGFEADVSGRSSFGLNWGVNYTYTKVTDKTDKTDPLIVAQLQGLFGLNGLPARGDTTGLDVLTARHKVNTRLGYAGHGFEADLFGRYRSRTSPFVQLIPAAPLLIVERKANVSVDARLAYKPFENLEVSVFGENLTRNRGAALATVDAPRRVRLALTATF